MSKKIVLFALWVVGSVVAIAVVSQGVRMIDDQVSAEESPIDLAAQDANSQVTASIVATTTTLEAPTATTSVPEVTVPPATAAGPTTTVTPATSPATAAPLTSPTTPVAPNPPPTPAPTAAPTTTAPPAAQVLTFNLVGGSTAISFSPTQVFAVWATPNSGYTVEIKPQGGGSTTVEFRSDDHRSRIDARWDGAPVHEIQEDD